MHSFHQSRGRILFDAFCALAIAASFAVAWMQTGAPALLSAAGVAALYGLVHAFDRGRPAQSATAEPQRIAFEEDSKAEVPAYAAPEPEAVTSIAPMVAEPVVAAAADQVVPEERAKAPRKSRPRRPKGSKEASVTELAPRQELPAVPISFEEPDHPPIEPLFEPEPFVRMPRPAFGRKAG
jgi:hypothetical protein